jgi:hypothetical protein
MIPTPAMAASTARSVAPPTYTTSGPRGFAFFGGVPLRGIHGNMKTAVTIVLVGKKRVFNRRFLVTADHYMVDACAPRSQGETVAQALEWERPLATADAGIVRRLPRDVTYPPPFF